MVRPSLGPNGPPAADFDPAHRVGENLRKEFPFLGLREDSAHDVSQVDHHVPRGAFRLQRILSEKETVQVLLLLEDPQLLICETCLSTGARISEVLGLMAKHIDLEKGIIQIQQRHCRGDVDVPKTKNSRRVLTLGSLVEQYRSWMTIKNIKGLDQWLFPQDDDPAKPMWDSGVRKALKIAAVSAACDFVGLGLHSLRRANITWRQEVGASAIEASKIAGHSSVNMTNDYTHVQLKRQGRLLEPQQSQPRVCSRICSKFRTWL